MFRSNLVLFALLLSVVGSVFAEKAPLTPAELRSTSTHVVTGQVTAIYSRNEDAGEWRYTKYVAEIRVGECEKGEGIKKGELIYVRYWQRSWIGKGKVPPSTAGHSGLPRQGDQVRVYLAWNAYDGFSFDNKDGGFNVIGGNGYEELKSAPSK